METESLLATVVEADEWTRRIIGGPQLPDVVGDLVATARRHGCELLLGAGPGGHQLVGAVAHATSGELRPWGPGMTGNVLVIDAVTVGLVGVTNLMHLIRTMTDGDVHGVALTLHPDGSEDANGVEVLNVARFVSDRSSSPLVALSRERVLASR